jgi:hypothetical protein
MRDYDVTFTRWETLEGIKTARLELSPRTEKLRRFFSKVTLWMDLDRDVAIQQKRLESSGDYQLARYSHFVLSSPDDVFTIKK